jgi:L-glyceraldehyde 3-phosphate reductase
MGSSGLTLSEIAFGCGGNAGLMVRGSLSEQVHVVARALELGITYFDNSPDYGGGLAEENLGRVLKQIKTRPVLNSKVEIRAENLHDIAGHIVRSTQESLSRLGVDYLDVLQVHNGPIHPNPVMEGKYYSQLGVEHFLCDGGVLDGVRQILERGLVRHTGFICRGNDGVYVRQMLDMGLWGLINVPFTLLNPTAGYDPGPGFTGKDFGGVLNAAHLAGVGSSIYSPLAGGFLADNSVAGLDGHPLARKSPDPLQATSHKQRQAAAKLQFLSQQSGLSLAQAAYRFILMHEGVTTVLGGFSSIEQLEEITRVPDLAPFSPDLIAQVQALWARDFRDE